MVLIHTTQILLIRKIKQVMLIDNDIMGKTPCSLNVLVYRCRISKPNLYKFMIQDGLQISKLLAKIE